MRDQHPGVRHLIAALDQAEATARAATPGPWEARHGDPRGDLVCSAHDGEHGDLIGATVAHVFAGVRGGYDRDPGSLAANMQLIAAWNSAVVLRMVAADRSLLAEHAPNRHGECAEDYRDSPCPTVLNRARAWGWEGES